MVFNHSLVDDARAWALVAAGNLEEARNLLDAAADDGHRRVVAVHRGQRARQPRPTRPARARRGPPAGRWPTTCQGRVIPAWSRHAEALAEGDGEALAAAAATFVELGMLLHAAEAEADSSRAYRKAGRSRDAAAAAQRSQALARQCEGATTPALVLADEVTPLTRREREVALLAAQGLASKDIAEKLFLSVRTVENHLQRAYEKLGIAGRDELAGVIGAIGPG